MSKQVVSSRPHHVSQIGGYEKENENGAGGKDGNEATPQVECKDGSQRTNSQLRGLCISVFQLKVAFLCVTSSMPPGRRRRRRCRR